MDNVLFRSKLKGIAQGIFAEVSARVARDQSGVTTFFDTFITEKIARLQASTAVHAWNSRIVAAPGTEADSCRSDLLWIEQYHERRAAGRFVPFSSRRRTDEKHHGIVCDVGSLELVMSQGTFACMTWKGKALFKTVYDFNLLSMLLWELRPASIIEIGSGAGASAVWMADMLEIMNIDGTIYSIDIKPVQNPDSRIHYVVGDCNVPSTLLDGATLKQMRHPILLIEDAHVNVLEVLLYFHPFLTNGDYLIVEDSPEKQDFLSEFAKRHDRQYKVDTLYTDFFGRNATSAMNSIFKRIQS